MKAERKFLSLMTTLIILLTIILPRDALAVSSGISASGAVLMEQSTGRVLSEKNAHETHRIASITKIMTAILAIESNKMDEMVKISKQAVYTAGSSIYLQPDEQITLENLMYGLMLRSGNDAAYSIAEYVGGSQEGFVFLMNQKAAEIGMTNTVFANPHGLDDHEEHYSTAYDMALLTRYAMENDIYRKISNTKVHRFTRETGAQQWTNKNRLLTEKYKYCTGGKTGYTKRAGRTLVTTAEKNGIELIAVTLNAGDDWNDHINMFEQGFQTIQLKTVLKAGKINEVNLPENKALFLKTDIIYPLEKKEYSEIRIEYQLLNQQELAKMTSGVGGLAIIYFQNKMIVKAPLYIEQVEKKKKSWWDFFRNLFLSRTSVMRHD